MKEFDQKEQFSEWQSLICGIFLCFYSQGKILQLAQWIVFRIMNKIPKYDFTFKMNLISLSS